MKYVALLRGINVGGKNIIKMADLKKAVENCGFTGVSTYIQSGNVLFESDNLNIGEITGKLGASFMKYFNYDSRIVVRNYAQFKKIVSEVPSDWKLRDDLRCDIAFIADSVLVQTVMSDIELKENIDFIKAGEGVLYMSTLLNGLTRSSLTRLISKKVYRDITIRKYNTAQKLLELME